ncbi:MAG: exodeoxyribonuclease VII large subunit [Succinivibrio sp.]|nr:exodeoxyribonuclease VII large subunit [Succinivibrio sp.]
MAQGQTQQADFTVQDGKRIFSVSGFLRTTQQILRNLGKAYVQGEVSSISDKYQLFYLVLQDSTGSLSCAVPRAILTRYKPVVGDKILIFGSNSLNVKNGQYSFWVEQIVKLDGMGMLAEQLRALKERLTREGVFARPKRPIPLFVNRVGVITSEVGSVIHDIERTLKRRNPLVELYLYPTRVQGEGAAQRLTAALNYANSQGLCDVLIIGRGGGSFEDLLPFYDEILVRAVAASRLPIISAVGHETDTPFCDFAADVRAATPTAAAELCTAITHEQLCLNLDEILQKFDKLMHNAVHEQEQKLALCEQKLHSFGPEQQLGLKQQRLQLCLKQQQEALIRCLMKLKERETLATQKLLAYEPKSQLALPAQQLVSCLGRMQQALESKHSEQARRLQTALYAFEHSSISARSEQLRQRYLSLINKLEALDPLKILKRGYSVTLNAHRQVADFASLEVGERIETILAEGILISEVVEKKQRS